MVVQDMTQETFTDIEYSCRMYLTTQLTGNDTLKTASPLCDVRLNTHFGS